MGVFKKSELKKHYEIGADLGRGNFAVVKLATYKGKESSIPKDVAIKIIDKAKVEDLTDIKREVEIMSMVSHPNVIKLYEIYEETKKMHLVMELVTGGELFDRIVSRGSYTEKDAANTVNTLCSALEYLHELKIVHRDLKPENILYASPADDAEIKVADFGLARVINGKDLMKTACGTPGYVAPEILKNQGYDSGAVDMWSVGVILYILLCGFPPFYEEELPALFEQILKAQYDFPSPWWDEISKDAKDVVKKLLELDPKKRHTASQVMQHNWIKNASTTKLPASNIKKLRGFQASRKMKKAGQVIMAARKLAQGF